ncbi:lycopene cyclase [Rudanella paleaurantiibacter]|uniref:Lycopene cyclase n=1 Tax=Rudanella paleaurantiibacter TaxID=2614655 RepID=A0A7J5U0V7_9BACT|nr:lycopene cyclase family protein [Rudanella paleaurantiibacter]KAB7731393.1 lycopene cyclase [Rudanella paleaurantiibacter]
MKKYDFIIAGGGMAGLSMAYYLTQSPLRDRSILLLDRESKNRNDRTWCFWERGEGPFESILFRNWDRVEFHGTTLSGLLNIGDYRYKMLRGIDFYAHIQEHLARFPNIEIRQANINRIKETAQGGFVIADDEPLMADYVFDSTFALKLDDPDNHNLLQHFKGWVIRTEKPCFNVDQPRMMDFRVAQHGDCRFAYVLPFDAQTALIEFTLFNETLLTDADYEAALGQYITQHLDTGTYQICETEFGVIPMSDVPTQENPSEHIVRIGTAGGHTKASTGYTFQRTQRYLRELVQSLAQTGKPFRQKSLFKSRFKLYDSIFLNVLQKHRYPADDMFTLLYEHNSPAQVFKFLDEDTSLGEDLRVMWSMPKVPFTMALFDVLRRKLLS